MLEIYYKFASFLSEFLNPLMATIPPRLPT